MKHLSQALYVSSKQDGACREEAPNELFIEMENCTDYSFQ